MVRSNLPSLKLTNNIPTTVKGNNFENSSNTCSLEEKEVAKDATTALDFRVTDLSFMVWNVYTCSSSSSCWLER